MKRAIVVYIENKENLLEELFGLYVSYKYIKTTDTDLVVFGPQDALKKIPDDCIKVECNPISGQFPWTSNFLPHPYHFINSIYFLCTPEAEKALLQYDYVLKTDADTFLTSSWNEYYPLEYRTGRGSYVNDQITIDEIKKVYQDLNLNYKDIHNIGATHYGKPQQIIEVMKLTYEISKHLLENKFNKELGKWPSWFYGVTSMYAGEIAVNHLIEKFIIEDDNLDCPCYWEGNIKNTVHIHLWHTKEFFSKHKFKSGEYNDIDIFSIDINKINNYCLYMVSLGIKLKNNINDYESILNFKKNEMKKHIEQNNKLKINIKQNKKLKICHVGPFAPNSFGLYEAARDMVKADTVSGHEVHFVDRGARDKNGNFQYAKIGTIDNRGGFGVIAADSIELDTADIIIVHSMPDISWMARNQAPIIYMLHDRPLYSFKINNDIKSYDHTYNYISQPRVKKFVYFWPEFKPYWEVLPQNKSVLLDYPPIDEERFTPHGDKQAIDESKKGEFNILVCDSWGREIDVFEIINGAMQYAREYKNVKFHIYDIQTPLNPSVDLLLKKFQELGCVGGLYSRIRNMEAVYRSMDAVLTPHRIITRVIGEALLSGIPVIASNECKVAQFGCDPQNPYSVATAIKNFVDSDKEKIKKDALEQGKKLHLENYSKVMNKVYEEITNKNTNVNV